MRLFWKICILFLLFPIKNLQANEENELYALRSQASIKKNLQGYSAVCQLLFEREIQPQLLLTYADSIRQLAFQTKSIDCFIEYYSWSAEASYIQGDFTNGYILKRKALLLAERMGRKHYVVDFAADMGYYFNVNANYDSARHYLRKGMEIAMNLPERVSKYRLMLTNYASSFLLEGKTDSALVYTLKAKERSAVDKDTAMLIENLNQLGTIYRRKKNLEDCISNFEKSLELCKAQNNFQITAYIYANIATAYCDWDRSMEAVPFSRKAVEYALRVGNPQMVGICYINLGAIQVNVPELLVEGIETLQKAVPILEKINNKRRLCEAYRYLVNAYRRNGDNKTAANYLEKLDALTGELKTDVEKYGYYRVKAPFLQGDGQYAEAIKYLRVVIKVLTSVNIIIARYSK